MAFHDFIFEMIIDVFSNIDAIILEYNTYNNIIYIYKLFMRFLYVFQDTRTYIFSTLVNSQELPAIRDAPDVAPAAPARKPRTLSGWRI